jgi:hypothetical protein
MDFDTKLPSNFPFHMHQIDIVFILLDYQCISLESTTAQDTGDMYWREPPIFWQAWL